MELEDVRVAPDQQKTFILGTDVMSGNQPEGPVLPWTIMLSGLVRIPLRRENLPWMVSVPLTVPPEARYKREWD